MELMRRRRVSPDRSISNCHNLPFMSDSWESWRVRAEVVGFDALSVTVAQERKVGLIEFVRFYNDSLPWLGIISEPKVPLNVASPFRGTTGWSRVLPCS